jgi:glutamate-1-semialdehyde 2,1-aminomutase
MNCREKSQRNFIEAQKYIPGGVNSPVRSFRGVGGEPIFIDSAKGACLFSVDGEEYIDYVGSWGPMIAGHAHPKVIKAIEKTLQKGTSFGAPTSSETELAKEIRKLVPSMQKIRLVNSGTEATMSALRVARGYTQRELVLKFEGCYHGHADSFLVQAGSGLMTLGKPNSAGVPESVSQQTLVAEFNNQEQVRELFAKYGEQIAAIIVEPVAGNMNCIPSTLEFLQTLREVCDDYGSVLIFDEVMSGFRVALGGAQEVYGIIPDMTTIGKVIGGGLPVGALGGKEKIMDCLAPLGSVYQAGTLSGNPLAVSAGLATLEIIQEENFFRELTLKTQRLLNGLHSVASEHGVAMQSNHMGGMFGLFFDCNEKVTRFSQVHSGVETYNKVFHLLLQKGVYFAPSAYEAGFISSAHQSKHLNDTLRAFNDAISQLVEE